MKTCINKAADCVTVTFFEDNRSIATAGMDFFDKEGEWVISRVLVRESHRRKGLGRQLLLYLKENSGGCPIAVHPGGYDLSKEEQFSFYSHCGFVKRNHYALVFTHLF